MNQVGSFEQTPGGPLQLDVGGTPFSVSQMIIEYKNPELEKMGVVAKGIVGLPAERMPGAKQIIYLLDTKASDPKSYSYPAVNALYFEFAQPAAIDSVVLKIPVNVGSDKPANVVAMLNLEPGKGKPFIDALQGLDKAKMQSLLGKISHMNKEEESNIIASNLAVFQERANKVAKASTTAGANLQGLYADNQDKMTISEIPHGQSSGIESTSPPITPEHEIDLNEFVAQSKFFRDTPNAVPGLTNPPEQIAEAVPVAPPELEDSIRVGSADASQSLPDKENAIGKTVRVETEDEKTLEQIRGQMSELAIYCKVEPAEFKMPWMKADQPPFVMGHYYHDRGYLNRDWIFYTKDYWEGATNGYKAMRDMGAGGQLHYFMRYWLSQANLDKSNEFYNMPEGLKGLDIYDSLTLSYIEDPHDSGKMRLMVQMPTYPIRDWRPDWMAEVFFALPKEQCDILLESIREDPNNIETLIQLAFGENEINSSGIDSLVKRRSVHNVLLVNVKRVLPQENNYEEYSLTHAKGLHFNGVDSGAIKKFPLSQPLPQFQQ